MRISKYVHSCLLLEKAAGKLLFDPGTFSFAEGAVKAEQFRDLTAILITHAHPDHLEEAALKTILANNSSATVFANSDVQRQLSKKGIAAEVFESGSRNVGDFEVTALAAAHAETLGAAPPQNTAYLVDGIFLNPGDSFAKSLDAKAGTLVLALPIMAPWNTELEVAEFAQRMQPQRIIPIHDGYAKDFFLRGRYENYTKFFAQQGMRFEPLPRPGDAIEVA